MVDIPFDVVTEIISWVPARSLLRFRCVCRSWYALLHESGFIELHLLRAHQSNHSLSILYNDTDKTSYCVHPAALDEPVKLQNMPCIDFCSSCNGLVCTSQGSSITLCNPTTREHKELPPPFFNSTALEDNPFSLIGFGWEPMKDDYKVLGLQLLYKLVHNWETKEVCQLMVYTLRTNSWREIGEPYTLITDSCSEISQSTYLLGLPYFSTFFQGGLHSLVTKADFYSDNSNELIIVFDMGMEVCKEIKLPEYKNGFVFNSIGVLQGCLSVVRNLMDEEQINIWIMRRYGEEESWYKRFSIDLSQMSLSQVPGQVFEFSSINLVGFDKNKVVLAKLWEGGLISYNTETGRVEYVAICGTTLNWSYLGSHVDTLVSLKSYGDNNTMGSHVETLNNAEKKDAQITHIGQRLKCFYISYGRFFISLWDRD